MSTKITEIIPDDIPEWATTAMHDGQFFRVALSRIEKLSDENTELQLKLSQVRETLKGVTRLAVERGKLLGHR